MAQNVTIAGAQYTDVPAVDIPKTGGGIAKFVDTSDADATAADIMQGKTAYVNDEKITGTGSGGGSTPENWRFVTFTVPSNTATVTIPIEGTPGVVCIDAGIDHATEDFTCGSFMLTRYTVLYTRYSGGSFAGGRCAGTNINGTYEHYQATGSTYNTEESTITIKSVSNVLFAGGFQYTLCYSLLNS